jgi:hypothetical protein
MPSPHIDQVRQMLMDTLADLRNREAPMDIERAKAVATVASVLVDTAKVENDYLKLTGQERSTFLEQPTDELHPGLRLDGPAAHNPFPTSVRHRLQG